MNMMFGYNDTTMRGMSCGRLPSSWRPLRVSGSAGKTYTGGEMDKTMDEIAQDVPLDLMHKMRAKLIMRARLI